MNTVWVWTAGKGQIDGVKRQDIHDIAAGRFDVGKLVGHGTADKQGIEFIQKPVSKERILKVIRKPLKRKVISLRILKNKGNQKKRIARPK